MIEKFPVHLEYGWVELLCEHYIYDNSLIFDIKTVFSEDEVK
jgi:hypothetical protein